MWMRMNLIAALALVLAGCGSDGMFGGGRDTTPDVDKTFVTDAASAGMMEVQLGRLAGQKADDDEVKEFGKQMADDHSKANEELKTAARDAGIKVPEQMIPAHRTEVERLTKLSGEEFDRQYIRAAVRHHKESIASFEQEAAQGDEPSLKQFAIRTLPKLREHLQMAQRLQEDAD